MHYIGKIDKSIVEKEFGTLKTDEVVLTDERAQHIKERHVEDFTLFDKNKEQIINNSDAILKDRKNGNTIFMIKHIEETNMNIVVKLAIVDGEKHFKNSIMTAYRIRDKNLKKLENKNKILYKHE